MSDRSQDAPKLDPGSTWRRWEPHVHAPGTVFNDQFKGDDRWGRYLEALEAASPAIEVLAVTDYYSTGTYETVVAHKRSGRLAGVALILPNVEMRLDVATVKGNWANVHLLVSPEDPNHVEEAARFMAALRFEAHRESFACTRSDLIRLGRKVDSALTNDDAAFEKGASQFKVNFSQLRDEWGKSDWARRNVIVAVAGNDDGTSGIRSGNDATLREEIEAFAKVVFASSVAQREFWLGRRGVSENDLRTRYNGPKPCLHGCDAHHLSKVAAPDGDRFSWIKGAATFDALRQACIDPARAYVGQSPPKAAIPSQVISQIALSGAPWAKTPVIPLNPGLVAVIGARGSGKTALADMIAAACDALPERPDRPIDSPSASFVERAAELLRGAEVSLTWQTGDTTQRPLDGSSADRWNPRVRYLSQQFVEELCSSTGVTDKLLWEIERVIYESHPIADRDGAASFNDLLDLRTARFRQARDREQAALIQLSERISAELEKDRQVTSHTNAITQKTQTIANYERDRAKLVTPGSEGRVTRLTELTAAAEKVHGYIRHFANQEQALLALRDEVADHRQNQAPEALRRSQERHGASRMKDDAWKDFLLDFSGDVNAQLDVYLKTARAGLARWKGVAPEAPDDLSAPYVADGVDLATASLAVLDAEMARLQKLVSADTETQRLFQNLSQRIVQETAAIDGLKEKLEDAQGAKARARKLLDDRRDAYLRVFEALVAEQAVLQELYRPLMERLGAASGTLRKLTFTVSRVADVAGWGQVAEGELVDLRRQGPFKGSGTVQAFADQILKAPWETGSPQDVSAAMQDFRDRYQEDLLQMAKVSQTSPAEYRAWSKRFAQWLFSTEHISLRYGIEYDGIDIRKLSPGTRGVVLLLLYLALDTADDRPLIIDQPEENLDPKSVFDELVGLFVDAKGKRQVIMVTHNANLVVNTDADQVIIADAGPHQRGELPDITYTSGGLDDAEIRRAVCDILEGGEHAFTERARRLRVRFEG